MTPHRRRLLPPILLAASLFPFPAMAAPTDLIEPLRPAAEAAAKAASTIPADRRAALRELANAILAEKAAGRVPQLTFICTHNSRRSHLSQIWAQTAALYHDVGPVKTFSGGTEATACNPRTVRALRRAGFSVAACDTSSNPVYLVQYAEVMPPLPAYSKKFAAEGNPSEGFIAVMTCDDANEACPVVSGATARIPVTYVDPKVSDDTDQEAATYDERCRQIAAEMFHLMELVAQTAPQP